MDPTQPYAQAIAISGNRIHALGDDPSILYLADDHTRVVDLGGLTIAPGFIDSHNHRITQRDHWGFSTIQEAVEESLRQGWTGLVDTAVNEDRLSQLIAVDANGELDTRVNVYLMVNNAGNGDFLEEWYRAYQPGQVFSPYLRIAGLKVFIDANHGQDTLVDQMELTRFTRELQAEGWQVAVRVGGILGNEMALDAVEDALAGASNAQFRHRFEHCLAASIDQVARMEGLGIIASIEPAFPAVLWHETEVKAVVGVMGIENVYRWRDFWDAGVFMTASTHNPPTYEGWTQSEEFYEYSHLSPMGVIYRGATQTGLGGAPPENWMLEKALTPEELLPMLTINGAYGTFEEGIKGSLTPGKWADLVVLSANPLETPIEQIADIQVGMTMIGGQVAYCADATEPMCLSPGAPSSPDFIGAVGNWRATDNTDGSAMTLKVTHLGGGSFGITWHDDDASVCIASDERQGPIPWVVEASGVAGHLTLELTGITGDCVGIDKEVPLDYTLEYHPQTDTLLDSFSCLWERE
jgi:predicted amidohydrolase YtcJ